MLANRWRTARAALAACALAVGLVAPGAAHAAPANDNWSGATDIPSLPYSHTQSTVGATVENGETRTECDLLDAGASVWFRTIPSASTRITLTTAGSSFDTIAAAYLQRVHLGEPATLTLLACNQDVSASDPTSRLSFQAEAGDTLYFQVAGTNGAAGDLSLQVFYDAPVGSVGACPSCGFVNHYAPFTYPAGETSIGVNRRTNTAMFLLLSRVVSVRWNDAGTPTWDDVTGRISALGTNDPILWTDPATGRTFVVQLRAAMAAGVGAGSSLIEYTDDDGALWVPAEPGIALPSWDHETVGGGPFPLGITNPAYPSAIYYCAQLGNSQCARSDDGGLTWGAPLPMNTGSCDGLHGHVVVDSNGNVYVPHKSCAAQLARRQGVITSADAGSTWTTHTVPGTAEALSDPAIAFDAAGRLYFATSSEGRAVVATSTDGGASWSGVSDVGAPFGVVNTEFPMAVAGDAGRAAVAFYGSTTPGDDQLSSYTGAWHLYISITTDGGASWQTYNATPGDPIQRGCIWLAGGSNPCRNLLDFQGMTVDAQGRVLVGYADGCVSAKCVGATGTPADSRASKGVIARQSAGPRLFVG